MLDKGEVVYQPDRTPTHVFVLLEGQVHLRLPAGAGETGMLVSQVRKGEFFGIAPLLGSDRYTTRAQCAEASRILFIEAKPFLEVLDANPVVGHRIMTAVARVYFDRYLQIVERIQKVLSGLALG
jgi:CRP-like cAMP-binding protein